MMTTLESQFIRVTRSVDVHLGSLVTRRHQRHLSAWWRGLSGTWNTCVKHVTRLMTIQTPEDHLKSHLCSLSFWMYSNFGVRTPFDVITACREETTRPSPQHPPAKIDTTSFSGQETMAPQLVTASPWKQTLTHSVAWYRL